MYSLTSSKFKISDSKLFITECSGAKTKYVVPNSVSGRVVNTSTRFWFEYFGFWILDLFRNSKLEIRNFIKAPSERPIQLAWAALVSSGQSNPFKSSTSASAKLVILNIHCVNFFCSTGVSHRSQQPTCPELVERVTTCSLASTVLSFGHQLTIVSPR